MDCDKRSCSISLEYDNCKWQGFPLVVFEGNFFIKIKSHIFVKTNKTCQNRLKYGTALRNFLSFR